MRMLIRVSGKTRKSARPAENGLHICVLRHSSPARRVTLKPRVQLAIIDTRALPPRRGRENAYAHRQIAQTFRSIRDFLPQQSRVQRLMRNDSNYFNVPGMEILYFLYRYFVIISSTLGRHVGSSLFDSRLAFNEICLVTG